jgi:hypothetical protein
VGQLTHELAETKDRLVVAQTIDLEVHTRENAQREQLQAKLIQERQTIVSLEAEMDSLKIELEEIQQVPPPPIVQVPVHPHVDEDQLRRMEQKNQEHQETIDLLRREVHRKDQRFWQEEANAPPSTNLFRTYETQRDLFLFLHAYRPRQWLSKLEFETLWDQVVVAGKENLLVEMLCRNVLKLNDPLAAIILVGDVGARVAMYYMDLELRIREKRAREMRSTQPRVTHFKDYGLGITHDIYSLSNNTRHTWTIVLKDLLRDFQHDDTIRGAMEAAVIREKKCRIPELNLDSYIYAYSLSL